MILRRRPGPVVVPPATKGRRPKAPDGATALVVGGGIAGVAAATVLAERGVRVRLIEREPQLGGRASAWTETLSDGSELQMERGFHGFFRQYYNLRALLRRVDPELSFLVPLTDYPLLGPNGARETFVDLPKRAPFNVAEMVRRTPTLSMRDLPKISARAAFAMLTYDERRTYARWDGVSAREYLDSLHFPPDARQMLFDVFSHSFFNPEEELSAAEMLMYFHFYFLANPEGLVFDVLDDPFSTALWEPFSRYLQELGVEVELGRTVARVEHAGEGHRAVLADGAAIDGDVAVLALSVPGLKQVASASSLPASLRASIETLDVTWPFAVLRLWLDRPPRPDRAPFAGTTDHSILDNISVYEKFEGESRAWAQRTGGSVIELHAYACPPDMTEDAIRRELVAAMHRFYPETKDADVIDERLLVRRDCPSFRPGAFVDRPGVDAGPGLGLAGDFVHTPFPSALMERAASSGFLAANHVLQRWDVRPERLRSIPPRGLLAGVSAWF